MKSLIKRYILNFLWRIGYHKALRRSVVNSVCVIENNEPLVLIARQDKIIAESDILVRESVLAMLSKASGILSEKQKLFVKYGYRPVSQQKKLWDNYYSELKNLNPDMAEGDLLNLTIKGVAKPTGKGPHQTGGAVDVWIIDESGEPLDFGGEFVIFDVKTPMFSKGLTKIQIQNRKYLRDILSKVGFAYYPLEWWHFSYGDQAWAAYKNKNNAIYGHI